MGAPAAGGSMIDHKKYLRALKDTNFSELEVRALRRGDQVPERQEGRYATSASRRAAEGSGRAGGRRIHRRSSGACTPSPPSGAGRNAFAGIEKLLEGSTDPEAFYISATFYLFHAEPRYRRQELRPARLHGGELRQHQGEPGPDFEREGAPLSCGVARRPRSQAGAAMDRERIYVRFMSEVKLHRLGDASSALAQLTELDAKDPLAELREHGLRRQGADEGRGVAGSPRPWRAKRRTPTTIWPSTWPGTGGSQMPRRCWCSSGRRRT